MNYDFAKFSWDLFLKAQAFYLFSVSVLGGFALSENANDFNRIAIGVSISIASLVALIATNISLDFAKKIGNQIEEISLEIGYKPIPFNDHLKIVRVFRFITVLILSAGFFYILYVLCFFGIFSS